MNWAASSAAPGIPHSNASHRLLSEVSKRTRRQSRSAQHPGLHRPQPWPGHSSRRWCVSDCGAMAVWRPAWLNCALLPHSSPQVSSTQPSLVAIHSPCGHSPGQAADTSQQGAGSSERYPLTVEPESHCVAQPGLELTLPAQRWSRHWPACLVLDQ